LDTLDKFSTKPSQPESSGSLDLNPEWYQQIVYESHLGFLLIRKDDGSIMDSNTAMCNMLGYSREELLSLKVAEIGIAYDSNLEKTSQRTAYVLKESGTSFEVRHKTRSGREIDLEVTQRYLDKNGGLFCCFYKDVTESKKTPAGGRQHLKKTKEPPEETENQLHIISEAISDIIMVLDEDGRCINIMSGNEELFLQDKKSAIGLLLHEVLPKDVATAGLKAIKKTIRSTNTQTLEYKLDLPAGEKWFEARMSPLKTHKPSKKQVVATIRDTTELITYKQHLEEMVNGRTKNLLRQISKIKQTQDSLRESKERYHSLFQNVPIPIWEVDYADAKLYFDEIRSLGITDLKTYFENNVEETKKCIKLFRVNDYNKAIVDLFEADNRQQIREIFEKTLDVQQDYYETNRMIINNIIEENDKFSFESSVLTLKGNLIKHIAKFNVAPGCEKTLSRYFISHIDITEQRKLENSLRKSYESEKLLRNRLEQEMKQRINFTRFLVHELKTPLTPMLSASEFLASSTQGQIQKEFAQNVCDGAISLGKRIDELMDLARGEVGLLALNRKKVDFKRLLENSVNYYRPMTLKREQVIELRITGDMPTIRVDPDRIQQVILNLLDNASKFTKKGGEIIISSQKEKGNIIVEVQDSGSGIKKEIQQYLFQPYKRLDNKDNLGGLGIGLTLSKMLIELHGGSIWVNSESGEGATAGFTLPLASVNQDYNTRKKVPNQ